MNTELSADQQDCLKKLIIPFHPDAISWRVTNKSKDGKRGCVIPYGDQRAYTDRLNDVFTPAGWTRVYNVTTLSPVTRMKRDKTIQTGKVIVTCVVTIHALGSHSGSGEMWADDDNAMTRAEAPTASPSGTAEVGIASRCRSHDAGSDRPGRNEAGRAGAERYRVASRAAGHDGCPAGKFTVCNRPVGSRVDPTNRGLPANCRRRALLRGVPQGRLCTQCSGVAKSGSSELDSSAA